MAVECASTTPAAMAFPSRYPALTLDTRPGGIASSHGSSSTVHPRRTSGSSRPASRATVPGSTVGAHGPSANATRARPGRRPVIVVVSAWPVIVRNRSADALHGRAPRRAPRLGSTAALRGPMAAPSSGNDRAAPEAYRGPMRTSICDQLGIEYPVVAFSHCRDVVAAVTRAGGFGVLGATIPTPDQLEV